MERLDAICNVSFRAAMQAPLQVSLFILCDTQGGTVAEGVTTSPRRLASTVTESLYKVLRQPRKMSLDITINVCQVPLLRQSLHIL